MYHHFYKCHHRIAVQPFQRLIEQFRLPGFNTYFTLTRKIEIKTDLYYR